MRQHESPGYRHTKTPVLSLVGFDVGLEQMGTSVERGLRDEDGSTDGKCGVAFKELLVKALWMEVTSLFWVVFLRRAGPSGLTRKAGLSICCGRVACCYTSWALSRGAELKRVSVSGDWVAAISVFTDCQARRGAAAWRCTAETTPGPPA